jgi:hypothetical protein
MVGVAVYIATVRGTNDTFWVPCQGEARRGKDRQGERCGKGTSALTTGNLLGIVRQEGGDDCKEAAATALGRG